MSKPFVKFVMLVLVFCLGTVGGGIGLLALSISNVSRCQVGAHCSDGPILGAFSLAVLGAPVIGLLAVWGVHMLYSRAMRRRDPGAPSRDVG